MTAKPVENEKIAIVGFSNVKLDNVASFLNQFRAQTKGAPIQLFDAKNVAGFEHLYFAAINALNSFEKKTNISNNLEVEALLFASGQRQITKAVEMLGIKKGTSKIAALILAENHEQKTSYTDLVTKLVPGERNDNVFNLTDEKMVSIKKMFDISDLEIEASLKNEGAEKETVIDLVIERMALLVTKS